MGIKELLAWAKRGGSPPARGRGTVWMVRDTALGIPPKPLSNSHPAIVVSESPLLVIPGSDSHRYDHDAVTETFDKKDLNPAAGGIGFASPTTFNVCHEVAVADTTAFRTFVGELETASFDRVLTARKHCW